MRHYSGQGLRRDLARVEETTLPGLIDSLRRHGVDERVIAEAIAEAQRTAS